MDIRKTIKSRLKELKRTQYWLAKELGISKQRVWAYLNGTSDLNSEVIGEALTLLELELKPRK